MQELTEPSILYADEVFAPLDADLHLERIGGGFETEVYRTDDRRLVVKLKDDLGTDTADALACAHTMREVAESFVACLGPRYAISTAYLLARNSAGHVKALSVQPYICQAHPLAKIDLNALDEEQRARVADQLEDITWRSLRFYRETGYMPDLYGLSATREDRVRLSRPHLLPWHIWNFIFGRNLLRSCNLLLTDAPERRVVLVDYDLVRWPLFVRRLYFAVRWLLCWRDQWLISRLRRNRSVPAAKPSSAAGIEARAPVAEPA
jgi:hypothetical protein